VTVQDSRNTKGHKENRATGREGACHDLAIVDTMAVASTMDHGSHHDQPVLVAGLWPSHFSLPASSLAHPEPWYLPQFIHVGSF